MNELDNLANAWLEAKQDEQEAVNTRREIENEILQLLQIDNDKEGSTTNTTEKFEIKTTTRINRTVDGDLAQELAAEAGLSEHLGRLFRWKPSINMAVWKATEESITNALLPAITSKPGRASISITLKEENNG